MQTNEAAGTGIETPTREETINNLQSELDTLTGNVYAFQISLAETLEAIGEADEIIETSRTEKLSVVLNDRFELNHKLKYTNDDQRKIAVRELEDADSGLIAMQTARKNFNLHAVNTKSGNRKKPESAQIEIAGFAVLRQRAVESAPSIGWKRSGKIIKAGNSFYEWR